MFPRIPRLQVLVHPVPQPHKNPIARAYEPGVSRILLHPRSDMDLVVQALIRQLKTYEWQQWLEEFSIESTISYINKAKKYPRLYIPRWILNLEITQKNIPLNLRPPGL